MGLIYTGFIYCYGLLLLIAALFNGKARQWVEGRRGLFENLAKAMAKAGVEKTPVIWFHVSSLGEFEQGRPVLEAVRKKWPGKRILLTFFSPSGYNQRKNYDQADFVGYLPLDTPANARRFMAIVRPEMVFFVKYDFWFNFLQAIHEDHIPLYFISALFRENQHFFKWFGGWFRRHLGFVTHFFVQNTESEKLLRSIGIQQATLTGDTRFDRVFSIAAQQNEIPLIGKFCAGRPVFIAGSSWEPDETVFIPMIQHRKLNLKYIIAPHDTSPSRISFIKEHLNMPVVCYSELNDLNAVQSDILIIDSVGLLSRLYRYATVAFIGGGFGGGIHNIQEPVTFGIPVIFGPNFQKFREARDLIALGGAFSISGKDDLEKQVMEITGNPEGYKRLSAICRNYIENNRGATEKIMKFLG